MNWGWIKPILEVLIQFLERWAAKPRSLDEVNTPDVIRQRWATWLRDKLRDKDGGNQGQ